MRCSGLDGRLSAAALLACLAPGVAGARPAPDPGPRAATVALAAASVRLGAHPGFARVVFDLPAGVSPTLRSLGAGGLEVRLTGLRLRVSGALPPGLREVSVSGDTATLLWAPGMQARRSDLGDRLVVDVSGSPRGQAAPVAVRGADPPATAAAAEPMRGRTTPEGAPKVRPTLASPSVATGAVAPLPAARAEPPAPSLVVPNPALTGPALTGPALTGPALTGPALTGHASPAPVRPAEGTIVLPFAAGTGAAAFRLGGSAVVVFDEARPIDPGAFGDRPEWRDARVTTLPDATMVRLALPPGRAVRLARRADGWGLAVGQNEPVAAASVSGGPVSREIRPASVAGRLEFPMARPGRVVTIPDEGSGGLVLVGTSLGAPAGGEAGEALVTARHAPRMDLLATWQGIAVVPRADDLTLRAIPAGFALASDHAGAPLRLDDRGPVSAEDGRGARRFDLPPLDLAALRQRLQLATGAVAASPPQARGPARLDAAEAMLALGMGAEAQATATLAMTDDPRLAADPRARALAGAGAVLAGREAEAAVLDDPPLNPAGDAPAGDAARDEVALWRALRDARQAAQSGGTAPAEVGAALAGLTSLLEAYPEPLRAKLLPLAVETLASSGQSEAARRVLQRHPDEPALEFSRALLDAADGRTQPALERLDRLAHGADRDVRARAATRAIELRLAGGAADARQAADAGEKLITAWRGDARELAARQREAAWREQAGDPATALRHLREAADPALAESWPGKADMLRDQMKAVFGRALQRDAGHPMPPLEFAALAEENADLLGDGPDGQMVADRLADRLAALDLPGRAASILEKLASQAPPGAARAALGSRLAQARLDQNDPQGALMALSASVAGGSPDALPDALTERRALLFARASAARGDLAAADGALAALGSPAARDLRAHLLQAAGRWPEATEALRELAAQQLPSAGKLDAAQSALLLDVASAATQAGDQATLDWVRGLDPTRAPAGHTADMLRLLTEAPVRGPGDLPRAATEIALARDVLR